MSLGWPSPTCSFSSEHLETKRERSQDQDKANSTTCFPGASGQSAGSSNLRAGYRKPRGSLGTGEPTRLQGWLAISGLRLKHREGVRGLGPRGDPLASSEVQLETDKRLLPATAVLAVVVVVAVALVVVPFLVPVTNSIWREEGRE